MPAVPQQTPARLRLAVTVLVALSDADGPRRHGSAASAGIGSPMRRRE
ncbi:MAG: hypothetical protein ABW046_06595 [Actinoplanes sp.]